MSALDYTVYLRSLRDLKEENRRKLGDYATCMDAIRACERSISEFLKSVQTPAMTEDELLQEFFNGGELPWIDTRASACVFPVTPFARRRCSELAGGRWNDQDGGWTETVVANLSLAGLQERVRTLSEPLTFPNASGAILRLEDGTSLRWVWQEGAVTVTLRGACESRMNAARGLVKPAAWPEFATDAVEVSLDGCGLTNIPDELWNLPNIEVLSIAGNWLTELPPQIASLTKLQELCVSGNRLRTLPPEIGTLRDLRILEAEENFLARLPVKLGELANLTHLQLAWNQIVELPAAAIGPLTQLRRLDLDHNRLTQLPGGIGDLVNLTHLSLRNNLLTEIPLELVKLTRLATQTWDKPSIPPRNWRPGLDASGNPLVDAREAMGGIAYLKTKV